MGLVGRQAEPAAVAAGLEAALRGNGPVLLVCGEPGIGKTELAGLAHDRGLVVLTGRASPAEAAPPLLPWWQALAGRPEHELLVSSVAHIPLGEGLRVRWQTLDRVASVLGQAAAQTPTAVVLGDLHWADELCPRK